MDLLRLPFPNTVFDVVYCSHVLEHVENDLLGMQEMYRVLTPGGWALILVPITAEETFEDPSVIDPQERLRLFGQKDHVRRYGPDFERRLASAGFHVRFVPATDVASEREIRRCGLRNESVFLCTR